MERKFVFLLSFLSISFFRRVWMQGSSVDHYVSGQTSPWLAIIAEAEFGQFVSLLFSFCICICFFFAFVFCNCCYCRVCLIFRSFWLCCHLVIPNFVLCICISIFLCFEFVFVFCLCCYCRVWSICFRLFSLVFRLINFTRTTAAVIMSATSQRKMFKASKPQIPQFVWKGEGRGAKVWSILLLDTFLKFSPNQPTLDSVDSAGKRQAP